MTEREISEQPYQKTQDYRSGVPSRSLQDKAFRIRIYEKPGAVPIVLASAIAEKSGRSVSTVTGYLAAEILSRHFSRRLWEDEPLRWIEEERRLRKKKGETETETEYWQVEFRSFTPHAVKVWGQTILQITERGPCTVSPSDIRSDGAMFPCRTYSMPI